MDAEKHVEVRSHVIWSAVRNWGLRFGSAVVFFILARILPPDQIGLFSAVLAVLAFVEIIAENGLGDAVIQAPRLDDRVIAAAFWCNVLFGSVIVVLLLVLAPEIEQWLGAPGLAPLLSVSLLSVVFNSLSYVPQAIMRRKFEYRQLAFRALVATGVSSVVGLGMAFMNGGAWSMVAQFVIFCLLNFIILWKAGPIKLNIRPDFVLLRPLLGFSVQILSSKLLYYFASRIIEIVLLYKFGAGVLAFYVMGSRLTFVVSQMLTAVTVDVALTSFSRLASDRVALVESFFASLSFAMFVAVPVFVGIAAVAPEICSILYGEKGVNAIPFTVATSLAAAALISTSFHGSMLAAVRRPVIPTVILLCQAIAASLILLPHWTDSASLIVWVNSIAATATLPVYTVLAAWVVKFDLVRFGKSVGVYYLAAGLMMLAVHALRTFVLHTTHPIIAIVPETVVGAVVFLGILFLLQRYETLNNVRLIFHPKSSRQIRQG